MNRSRVTFKRSMCRRQACWRSARSCGIWSSSRARSRWPPDPQSWGRRHVASRSSPQGWGVRGALPLRPPGPQFWGRRHVACRSSPQNWGVRGALPLRPPDPQPFDGLRTGPGGEDTSLAEVPPKVGGSGGRFHFALRPPILGEKTRRLPKFPPRLGGQGGASTSAPRPPILGEQAYGLPKFPPKLVLSEAEGLGG